MTALNGTESVVRTMSESIMQTERECYLTGSTSDLHRHHIFGGSLRAASEKWGCWVYLRADWHNCSNYGVHFDPELSLMLKRECQQKFEELYGHDKFMEVFIKNYL